MIVHLNGDLVPAEQARVSPFDRGFLFGDGVYEGLRAFGGHVFAMREHLERLSAGLEECRMDGFDPATLPGLCDDLLRANDLKDAFLYWQITRGAPELPVRARIPGPMAPTVFGFASPTPAVDRSTPPGTKRIALAPDTRWTRGHIKSIALHGNVLAAIDAARAGHEDVVFVRDGLVSEGTSTNVFLSIGGRLVTPSLESASMLGGVTRRVLVGALDDVEVRPVRVEELLEADEAMLVGTLTTVATITHIDGKPLGVTGEPGEKARELMRTLLGLIEHDRAPARVQ